MGNTYDNRVLLNVREQNPVRTTDGGGDATGRGTMFGEQAVAPLSPDFHAVEGKYFSATTVPTTAATGVAGHPAPVAFIDTKPLVVFQNNNPIGSGIKIILKRLQLRWTAVGAGGTLPRFFTALDPVTNRYTSGGVEITAKPNARGGSAVASNAKIYHGVVVAPAASANQRILKAGQIRPVIPVIYDELTFRFGDDTSPGVPAVLSGTLVAQQVIQHDPVVLDPQDSFLLHLWRASQSGADSYEVDIGWIER